MITLELTEEEVETLIDALGTWMELPEECEGEEWVRRQGAGADLDMDLREALHRRHDGWDAACAAAAEDTQNHTFTQTEQDFIQAGIDAREQIKETSRAATRREEQAAKMMRGTVTPIINDPVDW
jgi:hypothetical protein